MSLDIADPSLPAPLRDVLAYEGVRVPHVGPPRAVGPGAAEPATSPDAAPTAVRWEVFGLPGLGKSTLCRALAARLHAAGAPALYLPEAVPYAVQVLGIRLADLEPFLDRVNAQAEALATASVAADARTTDAAVPDSRDAGRRAAPERGSPDRGSPGRAERRVVLRDPAHVQNESYRYVLHARRDGDALAALLPGVATAAAGGQWDEAAAAEFGRALVARHPAMRAAPRGAWRLGHLVLTTGDPLEDLALSARRQRNPERDPALVTDDPVTLTGYLAAIRAAEARTRAESGAARLIVDPRRPVADLVDKLEAATAAVPPPVP